MTVRFTYRDNIIRIFGAEILEKREKKYMKSKIRYTDEPMGELKIINDFLPSPDQLILKDDNVKITIALKKSSIDFSKKHHTSYQKMIRQLIDLYAVNNTKNA